MSRKTVRLGGGAGYSGDRIEPAVELAEKGRLDVLVFECLAERTIALAQQARVNDPDAGYDPLLEARLRAVLPAARANGVRIVTNMGAANPVAAARVAARIARDLGMPGLRVAAVTGDDVLPEARALDMPLEGHGQMATLGAGVVSANAYLGAKHVADALGQGADIVVTGRVADPALFLGPLINAFGWRLDDWILMGRGTLVGHLLECAGQITGGYFADPGFKDVPGLARLGFPIGEVEADGTVVVTKVEGSGGAITAATVKEQILYEIHDPARYHQPDVVADFSQVQVEVVGPDRVRVSGAGGAPKTGSLKVSVGYRDGFVGEGQISYAGPGAVERGRLALAIVRERLAFTGVAVDDLRFDLIGVDALHGAALSRSREPAEVRVRVAGHTATRTEAVRIGNEVETLYTNGPAGGGGAWKSVREILAIDSGLIPEDAVVPTIQMIDA